MSQEHRDEWIDSLTTELMAFPWSLVRPAVAEARLTIFSPSAFLSHVVSMVRGPMTRLVAEVDAIDALLQIAEG